MTSHSQLRRKILIVEDDEPLREILQVILQIFPHDFLFAKNGAHALQLDAENSPELILIDLGLPDISGFNLGQQLRQRNGQSQRLVALTGFDSQDYRDRAKESGFDEFHLKPMELEQMERTFATIIASLDKNAAGRKETPDERL